VNKKNFGKKYYTVRVVKSFCISRLHGKSLSRPELRRRSKIIIVMQALCIRCRATLFASKTKKKKKKQRQDTGRKTKRTELVNT
jgi:hypothetical protein